MIVDTFAGPGGWDEGLALLGRSDVVGLEWDAAACKTAKAAGHERIRCDVATYPTEPFRGIEGLIASPPCQAWSMAGKRKGEPDRANCHALADRMAAGDDSTDWTAWEDDKSPLVCQPVRWVRDLRPEWVALEEVPAVASLWEHFARIFRGWGYSVWTGDLCAADYGVPQTRTRRILMAHRTMTVQPPEPTHAEHPQAGADLFGGQLKGWISFADALGWGFDDEPSATGAAGGGASGGVEVFANAGYRKRLGEYVVDRRTNSKAGNGTMAPTVPVSVQRPSPTITGKSVGQWVIKPAWVFERPATTVVGSFCPDVIAAPGYRTKVSRQNAEGSVKITVDEAGVLQSFPADYPWQGSRSKRHEQVGNAIPPVLAMHVLAALGVGAIESERVA